MAVRLLPPRVVLLSAAALAACLPAVPQPLDDGTDSTGPTPGDGGSSVPADSTSGGAAEADTTIGGDPTTSSTVDSTTGEPDLDSSDSTSDTGEPTGCPVVDPLQMLADESGASNCRVHARFDPEGSEGLLELRAPGSGQDNLLYDGRPGAEQERLAATLLYDNTNGSVATWSGVQPAPPNTTYVMQTGPAVYRIHVTSEVTGNGPAGSTDFSTSTIYTVIADGRIMRDDTASVGSTPSTALWLVNYISLAAIPFTNLQWVGLDANTVPVTAGGVDKGFSGLRPETLSGELDWACLYHAAEGRSVGVGVFYPTTNDQAPLGPRASLVQHVGGDASATSVTLQTDWVRGPAIPQMTNFASEQLMVVDTNPDAPCEAIDAYHRAYLEAGTMAWDSGFEAVGEYSGGEGSSGTHFSAGGGFYWAAVPSVVTEDLQVHLVDAVEQPTLLLYVAALDEAAFAGVSIGGVELDSTEFIVQPANVEADGGTWALDEGLWVLIGVPVTAGQSIVIHTQR